MDQRLPRNPGGAPLFPLTRRLAVSDVRRRSAIDPPAMSGHRLMPTEATTAGRLHPGAVICRSKQVPTTSNHGVDEGSAAPGDGSIALLASLSAADGLLEDLSSNDLQLLTLVLAQSTQPGHRLALAATHPTHQDADCPVDHAARLQRGLQLSSQPLNLR